MGPGGAGKSALLRVLAGLDAPTSGTVRLAAPAAFVPADATLLPMLTVEENVLLPFALAGTRPERACVEAVLAAAGLDRLRRAHPGDLARDQRRRVAIARALAGHPAVLLADDPTAGLDPGGALAALDLLRTASERCGQTSVIATRDPEVASAADRVVCLAAGRVAKCVEPLTAVQMRAALRELEAGSPA
jgi:putative ABC transport system ATP-binding protein